MSPAEHAVVRGKGGWGTAEQTFSVRGIEYMTDGGVKVGLYSWFIDVYIRVY